MALHHKRIRSALLGASALAGAASLLAAAPALAQERQYQFDLPAQPLSAALKAYGSAADQPIIFAEELVRGRSAPAVQGAYTADEGLSMLLAGTGLRAEHTPTGVVAIRSIAQDPQGGSADAGAGNDVDVLIVTAQKREEAIQDVPIAISAFSQKALEEQKIEGGYDLMKAIPNVTFSKSNFSSYNFSIRGVGTKAISATTDPGVAVAFNNTTLIQNRLFEQEYFDVERVEVLRGPQGTLYGRNATSGVINVISAKPRLAEFEGSLKLEVGNYDTQRLVGMLNIPLVEDVLAVRVAGAMTKRDGYDFNEITGNAVNGRDLWSGRVTVGFEPTERLRANLLWEHFEEDDNRSRTGKQLCHRDAGPTLVGNTPTTGQVGRPGTVDQASFAAWERIVIPALFSQGCRPGSLYADGAFGTPNGAALPFIAAPLFLGSENGSLNAAFALGKINGKYQGILKLGDPYGGLDQSRDLRTIASVLDPVYRAKADVVDLGVEFDITDSLTLTSQTVYNKDSVYSFQDFNRFNSFPAFTDTSLLEYSGPFDTIYTGPNGWRALSPGGVFCDPQIGCTDRVAGFDISQAEGTQFSQELRLGSNFDGPVNFSVGVNYTKFETLIDYYVMYNLITALAMTKPFNRPVNNVMSIGTCAYSGAWLNEGGLDVLGSGPVPAGDPTANCPYIDPNPAGSINGDGHNYFRSKNPYDLKSKAMFGELYWEISDALKFTMGLRYTDDLKTFTPVPSQVLLAPGVVAGGVVSRGYPEQEPIIQEWGEWTGRLGLDWKPELGFTDDTMLYAFYSRGYKGGGANPPAPGFATREETIAFLLSLPADFGRDFLLNFYVREPILELTSTEYGRTFDPEFVNAFEVGAKNTLLGGAMTFNATGFFYDYLGYQVSQIRDRTAVNENFDAKIWGLEFETVFSPTRNLRIIANLGYLDTEIADGETSIDTMNRTQSNPNYTVVKPWLQLPSNCVVPTPVAESWLHGQLNAYWQMCGGIGGLIGNIGTPVIDPNPAFGAGLLPYEQANYPELNGGAGLRKELGGNELPNAPHWTSNIGAQYGFDVGAWRATVRTDAYWQSQSWARVYNAVNDKLHGWYNLNLSVWLEQPDWGVKVELYAKNILDKTPITDAFLLSDDTALVTNVFVLDPRLIGLSVRKAF